jgi:hypothetical protein
MHNLTLKGLKEYNTVQYKYTIKIKVKKKGNSK